MVGGGLGIGFLTAPGDWYAQLKKPPFTPPGWIFGPTWTVLYVLIGGTGWWLWQRAYGEWLMKLWWTQLVLNFMWSPVFFGLREIGRGLAVILLLLVVALVLLPPRGNGTARRHGSSCPTPRGWPLHLY